MTDIWVLLSPMEVLIQPDHCHPENIEGQKTWPTMMTETLIVINHLLLKQVVGWIGVVGDRSIEMTKHYEGSPGNDKQVGTSTHGQEFGVKVGVSHWKRGKAK